MNIKRICFLCCALSLFLCGCSGQPDQRFTSPSGRTAIIVKYDFVSRPTVYIDGLLFDREIWSYDGNGFMETVYFTPEWISETRFIFRYDDSDGGYCEEFLITTE